MVAWRDAERAAREEGVASDAGTHADKEKFAALQRQVAEHAEQLAQEPSPDARRLSKFLQRQLERDAVVRERLERRESIGPRTGGRGKKGKRAPYVELLRRALCYDHKMNRRGENWLHNPPRRGFADALILLQNWDVLLELMSPEYGEEILLQREVCIEDDVADFQFAAYVSKRQKRHLKSVRVSTLRRRAQEMMMRRAGC
jgi:hypothetical protein